MKSKNIFLIIIFVLCCSMTLVAQQRTISGWVKDAKGEPLIGVNVAVKDTKTGTITDTDGKFNVSASGNQDVLVFSYIGYKTVSTPVGDNRELNVTLYEDVLELEHVVVVGYGVMKKSDLTSSISSLKGSEIKTMTVGNFTQSLQGKVAGVQVVNGGSPGAQPKVLIRGFTTLNLGTDPLYVVDGIPMGTGANFLNPNEIENVEVLKDASASAIYGSRASNGVIMITTKKGISGKPKFTFDMNYGMQIMNNPYKMADAMEYAQIMNLATTNANLPNDFANLQDYAGKTTDWWDAGINKYSPLMNVSFGIQGGGDINVYSVSLNYYQQESFYDVGGWDKFTARITSDYKFAPWIAAGFSFNPRYESWGNPTNWADFDRVDPITPIYKPEDQLTGNENEYSIYARSPSYVWNPVATVARWDQTNESFALSSSAYLDIKPIKELIFRTQLSYDIDSRRQSEYKPDFVIDAAHEFQTNSEVSRSQPISNYWSAQSTLTYTKTFNQKHNLTAMIGGTLEEWDNSTLRGTKYKTPNNSEPLREIDAATLDPKAEGNYGTNSLMSYLSRISYNYNNKYYLTGTFRRDGSSKFMSKNKWATFPSASAAWRVSEEQFMSSTRSWISDLKLRLGWGQVGNQSLPEGVYESKLGKSYYIFDKTLVNTTYPSTVRNEDIKWETVEDMSAGIDYGFLNGHLRGSVDYYVKNTRDMLFKKAYPNYSGFPDDARIWTNIGSMQSKGWEFNVTYSGNVRDFGYDVGLTFTSIDVETKELTGDGTPVYGDGEKTKTVEGDEPAYYYGYLADGIFQNQTEINSHTNNKGEFLQPNAKPGDIRFVDVNGDGKLDANDRTKIGSPWADFTAGFNINLRYKYFDLMANFYASYGNDLVNQNKNDLTNGLSRVNKLSGLMNKAWHGEGTSNDIPRISRTDNNQNYSKFSSFYVEDGSFVRLKNLQIGYSLPKSILRSTKLEKARIYLSAQNLWTLTNFTGVEPEVAGIKDDGSNGSKEILNFGFAAWDYPVQPTVLLGVNLNF